MSMPDDINCKIRVRNYTLISNPSRWKQRGARTVVTSPILEIKKSDTQIPVKRIKGDQLHSVILLPRQDIEKDSNDIYKKQHVTKIPYEVNAHGVALFDSPESSQIEGSKTLEFKQGHRFWIHADGNTQQWTTTIPVINIDTLEAGIVAVDAVCWYPKLQGPNGELWTLGGDTRKLKQQGINQFLYFSLVISQQLNDTPPEAKHVEIPEKGNEIINVQWLHAAQSLALFKLRFTFMRDWAGTKDDHVSSKWKQHLAEQPAAVLGKDFRPRRPTALELANASRRNDEGDQTILETIDGKRQAGKSLRGESPTSPRSNFHDNWTRSRPIHGSQSSELPLPTPPQSHHWSPDLTDLDSASSLASPSSSKGELKRRSTSPVRSYRDAIAFWNHDPGLSRNLSRKRIKRTSMSNDNTQHEFGTITPRPPQHERQHSDGLLSGMQRMGMLSPSTSITLSSPSLVLDHGGRRRSAYANPAIALRQTQLAPQFLSEAGQIYQKRISDQSDGYLPTHRAQNTQWCNIKDERCPMGSEIVGRHFHAVPGKCKTNIRRQLNFHDNVANVPAHDHCIYTEEDSPSTCIFAISRPSAQHECCIWSDEDMARRNDWNRSRKSPISRTPLFDSSTTHSPVLQTASHWVNMPGVDKAIIDSYGTTFGKALEAGEFGTGQEIRTQLNTKQELDEEEVVNMFAPVRDATSSTVSQKRFDMRIQDLLN